MTQDISKQKANDLAFKSALKAVFTARSSSDARPASIACGLIICASFALAATGVITPRDAALFSMGGSGAAILAL